MSYPSNDGGAFAPARDKKSSTLPSRTQLTQVWRDAAECAECTESFNRLGPGAGVIITTLFSKIHCSPKKEAENFTYFLHFPHAAIGEVASTDLPKAHRLSAMCVPLFIPDGIATELGTRALHQPQYCVEDRRLARTARDRPFERVALDLCQFVFGRLPS